MLEFIAPGDICALCGGLPPGVPDSYYAEIIERMTRVGTKTILDASGISLIEGLKARPYLVKPNIEEAWEATGIVIKSEEDMKKAVKQLLGMGVTYAAISLGENGLVLGTRERIIKATPPGVAVRSTIGAGDALVAGLIWGLRFQKDIEEIIKFAVASGTAAVRSSQVGVESKKDILELIPQIELSEL